MFVFICSFTHSFIHQPDSEHLPGARLGAGHWVEGWVRRAHHLPPQSQWGWLGKWTWSPSSSSASAVGVPPRRPSRSPQACCLWVGSGPTEHSRSWRARNPAPDPRVPSASGSEAVPLSLCLSSPGLCPRQTSAFPPGYCGAFSAERGLVRCGVSWHLSRRPWGAGGGAWTPLLWELSVDPRMPPLPFLAHRDSRGS